VNPGIALSEGLARLGFGRDYDFWGKAPDKNFSGIGQESFTLKTRIALTKGLIPSFEA
jgi:hypothetical protein